MLFFIKYQMKWNVESNCVVKDGFNAISRAADEKMSLVLWFTLQRNSQVTSTKKTGDLRSLFQTGPIHGDTLIRYSHFAIYTENIEVK